MKNSIGKLNSLYPLPTVLVGTIINGKPNYITMAHVGILKINIVCMGMGKAHYSGQGIIENRTFSINIPSTKQTVVTDYCGLVSGKNTNKAELFNTFYGVTETAPMIEEFAVNMECKLLDHLDYGSHNVFIGEIVNTFCDDSVLTDGRLDLKKIDPILFDMNSRRYWQLGDSYANAWSIGKTQPEY